MGSDRIFLWRLQSQYLRPACEVLDAAPSVAAPPDPTDDEMMHWERYPRMRAGDPDEAA
jgi:hypothetical protein